MRGPAVQPIVIAAGGTGGHFFPAEALAEELVARGERIVLFTDARRAQALGPVFGPREHHVIQGAGLAGRGLRGIAAIARLVRGTVQARAILGRLRPAAVVGFGGYPAVPPLLAAAALRPRPLLVAHEQNAVMGRANRLLVRVADVVAVSFPDTAKAPAGTLVLGNPVRGALRALAQVEYAAPTAELRLLVLGGSLGARVFSDLVPDALVALPPALRARLHVVQQCRAEDLPRVRQAYAAAGIAAELASFFADVEARLRVAHLVVARAGASTVAELAVAGRPSLLVPLPGAIDDHQSANARALAGAGAALVLPQPALTAEVLARTLAELLADPVRLGAMAAAARSAGRPDAAAQLADLVQARIAAEARA
jgi:UDP-N-acetylglucosamine--N-acetylmuramyl-(pentapeptide) pyrophosphoryl-undecaprenol N-acetylglucosamine transferase